ncbi:hypothetical protein VTH06DRAFT_6320 [Thermothelomyces fergusii]
MPLIDIYSYLVSQILLTA